jgi:hypothetical protein
MAMKTRKRIALLIVAAIATTLLFSCAPKSVSIEERISDFFTSLNGDRTDTYTNLDPSTAAYSTGRAAGFWTLPFGAQAAAPFTYSPNPPVTTDPSNVVLTVSDNGGIIAPDYKFVMVNIGSGSDNWVISDIQHPAGATIF